tara:strand:+ start:3297 stop:3950 length:654 start_codon:yes stop_codon:yes gene_type:complete
MANYTYLVNDILEAAENDSTEFLNYIPKMIYRTEERLTRDLDDYGLVAYTSVAMTAGNNQVTLPSGTRIIKNINITANSTKINLLQRTDEYINDYWNVSASTGTPQYYARRNNVTVLIAPTPVSTFNGEVVHISRPTTLTSTTNTNYFTDYCYDALFNGSMVEAMIFNKNYTAVPLFEGRYVEAIQSLRNQSRRTRRDDMQNPTSPAGADNPIIGGN